MTRKLTKNCLRVLLKPDFHQSLYKKFCNKKHNLKMTINSKEYMKNIKYKTKNKNKIKFNQIWNYKSDSA